MSDTPKTDAVYAQFGPVLHPAVMAYNSVAREVERENADLRRLLAASLQDTERLNWLDAHPLKTEIKGGSDDGHTGTFWGCGSANLSLRETIDAMSAIPKS